MYESCEINCQLSLKFFLADLARGISRLQFPLIEITGESILKVNLQQSYSSIRIYLHYFSQYIYIQPTYSFSYSSPHSPRQLSALVLRSPRCKFYIAHWIAPRVLPLCTVWLRVIPATQRLLWHATGLAVYHASAFGASRISRVLNSTPLPCPSSLRGYY